MARRTKGQTAVAAEAAAAPSLEGENASDKSFQVIILVSSMEPNHSMDHRARPHLDGARCHWPCILSRIGTGNERMVRCLGNLHSPSMPAPFKHPLPRRCSRQSSVRSVSLSITLYPHYMVHNVVSNSLFNREPVGGPLKMT